MRKYIRNHKREMETIKKKEMEILGLKIQHWNFLKFTGWA